MLHDGAPSATSVDAFDLNHILQRAAVRHHSSVLEEQAAAAVRMAEERNALGYMESNIRAFAAGQEALEWRKMAKLVRHAWREFTAQSVLALVAEETCLRLAVQDAEGDDRLDIAKLKRIWRREREAALAEEAQQRAVREAQEAAPADAATAFRAFERCEANTRYTVALAELRDRSALFSLHEDLLDDMEEDTAVALEDRTAEEGRRGVRGGAAMEEESVVVEQQEQIRQLVVSEANIRYAIRRQQYGDRAALVDLHEGLWEDLTEESLSKPPAPPPLHQQETEELALRTDDVGIEGEGASAHRRRDVPEAASTSVPSTTVTHPGEAEAPLVGATNHGAHHVTQYVEEDEDAERRVIDDEWSVGTQRLYRAVVCYLAWEYDWVLAGPRRVVRSDKDLFRSQHHVPTPMRVPQKPLLHDRLGDLERFALHEALQHHGGVGQTNNAEAAGDAVERPSHLLFLKDRSPVRSAAHRSPYGERQSGASDAVESAGSAKTSLGRRDGSPLRARNDALLQSLLFHEASGRSALEHNFASALSEVAQRFEAELHRDLDWSLGWCPTANCRKAPRPPSYADRHLPPALRLRADPKSSPSASVRPPSNLYLTPQRSSAKSLAASSDSTGPLKLPVPPALIQRARSARADATESAAPVRLPALLKSS